MLPRHGVEHGLCTYASFGHRIYFGRLHYNEYARRFPVLLVIRNPPNPARVS